MHSEGSARPPATGGGDGAGTGAGAFVPDSRPPRIRVLGFRRERFVEFEYAVDEDLAVELILPVPAFHEFCIARNADVLTPETLGPGERALLAARGPGLYRGGSAAS